ncbi:MAG: peptidoglycan-binding domain-containing protein [Cardiobacteriaceae bacterium]|nr:peptidoglycan-binding domain-containing protein [Cardiobacteriaceae bacterium]
MKRSLSVILISAALSNIGIAQEAAVNPLALPALEEGKCTALVVVPAKFEPRTEQIVIKEESKTIDIVPAEYEWVDEKVEVKPETKRLEVIPAVFETVEEEIVIEPATVSKEVIAPQYSDVVEEVVAKPAHRAIRSEGSARTFSNMGEALRVEEVPAQHEKIVKKVVQEQAAVKESVIEPKTMLVKKQVLVEEARTQEVIEPAVYETVRVKKLVKEAQEVERVIPAEYAEVTVFEKVSDAEVRWEQVVCQNESNTNVIAAVQSALKERGYKVGTVDGVMGRGTQKILEKFQKDNNLAVGGITEETLKALGINP